MNTTRTRCAICGSDAWTPGTNGILLHRFNVGDRVQSTGGRAYGVVTGLSARHVNYRVRWDNGTEGRRLGLHNLEHDARLTS